MKNAVLNALADFPSRRVAIIGEAALDRYIIGRAERLNREAPVPVVQVSEVREAGGCAANAAVNLARLGARVEFISAIGGDREGGIVRQLLEREGVGTRGIVTDAGRRTLVKERVLGNDQMFVRFDHGSTSDVSPIVEDAFMRALLSVANDIEAVIISDYGYGVLTRRMRAFLKELTSKRRLPVFVDSKYLDRYAALAPRAVKPNFEEAALLAGITHASDRMLGLLERSEILFERTNAAIIAATIDTEGSIILERGKKPHRTSAKPVGNTKAIGAGDTFASAFFLSLLSGLEAPAAADVASAAAAIVLGKDGTAFCSLDELASSFATRDTVLRDIEDLAKAADEYRRRGMRIVFTNGCFDIIHSGHVEYLRKARALGDVLVVGINTDDSIRRLKGSQRPINTLQDRMRVLAALEAVDHVIAFAEDTPLALIRELQPDIYVKGSDYTEAQLPEAPLVRSYGGSVELIPLVRGQSTTATLRKIAGLSTA